MYALNDKRVAREGTMYALKFFQRIVYMKKKTHSL